MIVNQRVYDVTNFEKENKGESLQGLKKEIVGKEGKCVISADLRNKLNPYFIGYVKGACDLNENRTKFSKLFRKSPLETFYTAEEVKKHNKPNDAWIIIHGKVYDVSQYWEEHRK